jgi:hypothetical protein
MIGRFLIWVEDEFGHINRAFTWHGHAAEGIARARAEALARGKQVVDIWATPIANYNRAP